MEKFNKKDIMEFSKNITEFYKVENISPRIFLPRSDTEKVYGGIEIVDLYNSGKRDFSDINARGVHIPNADLKGADFKYANFEGTDLSGANFKYANLSGADFKRANLRDANLSGAKVRGENIIIIGSLISQVNLFIIKALHG
ncbi:MAG: pentapeptide repeat-containing protein [Candidatus Marsarchaeota archaeon]|nr:pentapeptide repeat-containing protein [Candidatus Marsarchaeota archaeon]